MHNSLGERIRKRRTREGISQLELARAVNRTQTWVSLLERDGFVPAPQVVEQIFDAISSTGRLNRQIRTAQALAKRDVMMKAQSGVVV